MSLKLIDIWISVALVLIAIPLIAFFIPLSLAGVPYQWATASLLLALQWLVGAALMYTAVEKRRGTELGQKLFPASVMSVVLWLAMLSFWWRAL